MRNTEFPASLPSLTGLFWSGVVVPDRVLSESNRSKLCNYAKLNCLKLCFFLYSTVCLNSVLMLNWIVWSWTVLILNSVFKKWLNFCVKWPEKGWYAVKPTNQPTKERKINWCNKIAYNIYWSELFLLSSEPNVAEMVCFFSYIIN